MAGLTSQIKKCIEGKLEQGFDKFIIFPFGDIGMQVKRILNVSYGIQEAYVLDNHLCKYNLKIRELSYLEKIDCRDYCLILSSIDQNIYDSLKADVVKYLKNENIAEISGVSSSAGGGVTAIGKYSYGPLCRNHPYIESIGAFCSFAVGTEVVQNHEMNYLTTHPMIYAGVNLENFKEYTEYKGYEWYFGGVTPQKDKIKKRRKIRIGNDVWLGRNVLITNYADIGNGVIAGAGSIITKDVPDYAVIAGAPARIIRYRYSFDEIEGLNKIGWWEWSDEKIRERYEDFYLPVGEFIKKYQKEG